MTEGLLDQGFSLLIYGVSVVFVFLTLLVILTTLMSKTILKFFPEPVTQPATSKNSPPPSAAQVDAQVMTAISTAVHKYRKDRKKK